MPVVILSRREGAEAALCCDVLSVAKEPGRADDPFTSFRAAEAAVSDSFMPQHETGIGFWVRAALLNSRRRVYSRPVQNGFTTDMHEIRLEDLDLASIIRPGDHIVWGAGPPALVAKLLEQRSGIGFADVFLAGGRIRPDQVDSLRFTSFGAMGNRALARAGVLHVIPAHLSALNPWLENGTLRADVVFVQLSAPDEEGRYSFGTAHDYAPAAMRHARVVIAEVNDQLPWTFCEPPVDPSRLDIIVRTSRRPGQLEAEPVGELEEQIARHVAHYIEDGSTIQIGIGAIPDAVLAGVGDRHDLGIHSGLITDRIAGLIEEGVVTNARKPLDTGITTTAVLAGTNRLYSFANKNRAIRLFTYAHTHNLRVLCRLDKFVAINSAVEVDVTGQVNAEIASGVYVGGTGGQGDFVRGAMMAERGHSIIALPSTAREGAVSRIVSVLKDVPITTPRSDADIVVTEFGAAELRGQPLDERIRRMIAITHPKFRDALQCEARAL
ncbi:MAG TPA: acetyl-CoA hydrolase/transferase C-terminal domain-containing protein [Candidatus Binataceae bacterium]|nr:acetyl-CoA hydrolase/transferase C-terminal domain-containing protein [Candidatus Binataceae bacterium]